MAKHVLTMTKCLTAEQIQTYLKDELNDDQRFEVENHMLDCPLCADAVEGFANSHNVDEELPSLDFLNAEEVIEITPEEPAKIRQLPLHKRWGFRVAASLLLLAIPISGFLYWQNMNFTQNLVAANFTDKDSPVDFLRSADVITISEEQQTLKSGIVQYQKGSHQEAYNTFLTILLSHPTQASASFYAGLAATKLQNWTAAEKHLNQVRINEPAYYDYATWHLVSVHLQQNKMEAAEVLLTELANNPKSDYQKRAIDILKEIQ